MVKKATVKPAAQRFCECGHSKLEHRHSLTTPQVGRPYEQRFERSFSECAIVACPCIRFVEERFPLRDPPRRAEPSVSQQLFE